MALFSRRKTSDDTGAEVVPSPPDRSEEPGEGAESADSAASVGISVAAYRGLGAQSATEPAPPPAGPRSDARAIPGVRDNVILREALARLPESPSTAQILEIARQLLQGHLFLRVKGDARTLLAEGKDVPLGIATVRDKQFVLAYSSGAALRDSLAADGETDTSAMGQPVPAVLRYVLAGPYAGLIVDNSSAPARAIIPRELLEKLAEQGDPSLELKTLLSDDRTEATASAVADALTRVKFWVAVNKAQDGGFGIAEARSDDGARQIALYSHPLEVVSQGRGDQAAPMSAEQLAAALHADEGLAGVIIDPGGPWIRLSRAELAPILALSV